MEEQLITFETAKLAKEKGFSINTTEYWEYQASGPERYKFITEDSPGATWVNDDLKNRICISTQSLLQRWLREVHNIKLWVEFNYTKEWFSYYLDKYDDKKIILQKEVRNQSFEEALEVGLQEVLKLISNEL